MFSIDEVDRERSSKYCIEMRYVIMPVAIARVPPFLLFMVFLGMFGQNSPSLHHQPSLGSSSGSAGPSIDGD